MEPSDTEIAALCEPSDDLDFSDGGDGVGAAAGRCGTLFLSRVVVPARCRRCACPGFIRWHQRTKRRCRRADWRMEIRKVGLEFSDIFWKAFDPLMRRVKHPWTSASCLSTRRRRPASTVLAVSGRWMHGARRCTPITPNIWSPWLEDNDGCPGILRCFSRPKVGPGSLAALGTRAKLSYASMPTTRFFLVGERWSRRVCKNMSSASKRIFETLGLRRRRACPSWTLPGWPQQRRMHLFGKRLG
mmetsp:Transcript_71557/g.232609  ORF Transcript_71557/g.232609 Transcript_71557/m.232609 type:complete len:244 (-) Transcript_71557:563-1294(-)